VVLRTFSPARAWRRAVVSRLPQTLGRIAKPHHAPSTATLPELRPAARLQQLARVKLLSTGADKVQILWLELPPIWPSLPLGHHPTRATIAGTFCSFRLGRPDPPSCCFQHREVHIHQSLQTPRLGSEVRISHHQAVSRSTSEAHIAGRQMRPNHSVNRRANGTSPGPGRRYVVHFRQPGPGAAPSPPGYLKR
jgi:hypothetical protein